jgi:hypothetical protein
MSLDLLGATKRARLATPLWLTAAICLPPTMASASDEWRFVIPQEGDEHEHPPLRAIPLLSEKPDDLREKAAYRGATRRYAQLRYGSPSAARVAVVLDQVSASEADLYVDVNRDRAIEPKERLSAEGKIWRVPLDVEYARGEVLRLAARQLVFRLGASGRTLAVAAGGYLQGEVSTGGPADDPVEEGAAAPPAPCDARRMDGDANGFFTDPRDRLWIDLNRDGRWDAAHEQFLYASVLTIDGTRYAVRSDERGERLTLARLEGTGTIKLALKQSASDGQNEQQPSQKPAGGPGLRGKPLEISVTLVGRDGAAVGLRGVDATASVPIGDYRVSAVSIVLEDGTGDPPWNFVFSESQAGDQPRWHTVSKDATIELDPLGKLEFSTGCAAATHRPGEEITVQPRLLTGDGLLINTCYRGAHDTGRDGPTALVTLASADGSPLATARSGFA